MLVGFEGLRCGMIRTKISIPTRRESNLKNWVIVVSANYLTGVFLGGPINPSPLL